MEKMDALYSSEFIVAHIANWRIYGNGKLMLKDSIRNLLSGLVGLKVNMWQNGLYRIEIKFNETNYVLTTKGFIPEERITVSTEIPVFPTKKEADDTLEILKMEMTKN